MKWETVAEHGERRAREVLVDDHGIALRCSFCDAPAVAQGRGWHKLLGLVPLLPRKLRYCAKHKPGATAAAPSSPGDEARIPAGPAA